MAHEANLKALCHKRPSSRKVRHGARDQMFQALSGSHSSGEEPGYEARKTC